MSSELGKRLYLVGLACGLLGMAVVAVRGAILGLTALDVAALILVAACVVATGLAFLRG